MLVLSRKTGQRIMVGDDIIISIQQISPGVVQLGIKAPKETKILREELITRNQEKRDGSTQPTTESIRSTGSRSV